VTEQLIYPSGWITMGIELNLIAMLGVDRFPRQKYMSFGRPGCLITLACEAAIIAVYVSSTNTTALKARVAMLFVFEVFFGICLDG
jgi:multisubunit Na+/H+ antiporter MnhG subunit